MKRRPGDLSSSASFFAALFLITSKDLFILCWNDRTYMTLNTCFLDVAVANHSQSAPCICEYGIIIPMGRVEGPPEQRSHIERPCGHPFTLENSLPPIEQRAMERLWRAANISDLGTCLAVVEEAWEQGDDERILETFRNSPWRDDTIVDFIFLELVSEDEERALPMWRTWVRANLRESAYWRTTKVVMARGNLDTFEHPPTRQQGTGGLTRLDILGGRMDQILIEEAEAYKALSG